MSLQGADGLRRRLHAISAPAARNAFARQWQEATVRAAQPMIPVRTGATRASIRPGRTRAGNATVIGRFTINFIDAGSKEHTEPRSRFTATGRLRRGKAAGTGKVLKFQAGGQTIFARKVNKRRIAARPFKHAAALKGLETANFATRLLALWNRAA